MYYSNLHDYLTTHRLEAEKLGFLLQQGIEVERLRLQIEHCTESESIESHIKIIQGERFLSLLIAARIG